MFSFFFLPRYFDFIGDKAKHNFRDRFFVSTYNTFLYFEIKNG